MKATKKILSLFLAVLMLVCILPLSAMAEEATEAEAAVEVTAEAAVEATADEAEEEAAEAEPFELSVNPYGNAQDSIDTIKWFKQGLEYFLFLPADCNVSDLTVYFNYSGIVLANGKVIKNGESTNAFATPLGKVIVQVGLTPYIVTVMKSANIPAMYIDTEESMDYVNASQDNKSKGNIRTYDGGELTLDSELKQIKGRGNSTWNYDKKGYNIKFDEKTELLGMPKAKKWSMIACYIDPAMDKNPIGWELANQIGLDFSSEYRFVDLYINGEYLGTYTICESVEIGENRVDITDLTKATEKVNKGFELEDFPIGGSGANGLPQDRREFPNAKWVNIPNDPKDITGGYLLECEYLSRIDDEISTFATTRGQSIVVKEPEYASEAQVKYISGYWQEAEDAICSPDGYNALGKHYSDYFDVDSLVNMYILLEFSGNTDAGISSTYFYKDAGEKIVASPIWDNDTAFGNFALRATSLANDPTIWTVNRMNYNCATTMPTNNEYPTIYNRLYRHAEFREMVSKRWAELSDVFSEENIIGLIDSIDDTLRASGLMNGVRWFSVLSGIVYDGSQILSKSYVTQRIAYLNKGFGPNAAQLYYDPNGGIGWSVENRIMVNGDVAIVNGPYSCDIKKVEKIESISDIPGAMGTDIIPPSEDMEFAGWNTKPDGSGKSYLPGEAIRMNGVTTLYAQWKTINPKQIIPTSYEYAKVVNNPIISVTKSIANVLGMLSAHFFKL